MCSIFGILNIKNNSISLRKKALKCSNLMKHRGPDSNGIYCDEDVILVHERLSIIDVKSGNQPLFNNSKTNVLIMNGEIYNYEEIKKNLIHDYSFNTNSDNEVVLALYKKFGLNFLNKLNGMFAFILYDIEKKIYLIGRDHIGMIPLYMGYDCDNNLYISSEMKALIPVCNYIKEFPIGSYLCNLNKKIIKYYKRNWFEFDSIKNCLLSYKKIKHSLKKSVLNHLKSEVPFGILLSGGLDSSIIASIASKELNYKNLNKKLKSFSIGLENSPDLHSSRICARYLNTDHCEVKFTEQDGLDVIKKVIYYVETYDITTIRASIPMYLISQKIKSSGIKMILSGEGADEIFGGYLYFHNAPSEKDLHDELVRKLKSLHIYDCARANKSMLAFGIEARFPFLDKKFLDVAMRINPKHKMCNKNRIEKYILRKSFINYLPNNILWRQKEQFSDGVGYKWIDSIKNFSKKIISDKKFNNAIHKFPYNTPLSKEEYLYREIFENFFPLPSAAECVPQEKSIACSSEIASKWSKYRNLNFDPSGRSLDIHISKN
ncbi:asnB [Wigglesworthia glossinidia endosymbiont of Glossina brevipalpis]|uniref:asparagine synthase (glutamine-hydrolyzing) n=1 Tax=Wigglesworthia glossinidia brevipalpis TaxID=36870 RepID=Q8D1W9_WIGBR|nr:asnB [Wigglesworthia glossinidia endosymbiont of Glossina brevipalpis]